MYVLYNSFAYIESAYLALKEKRKERNFKNEIIKWYGESKFPNNPPSETSGDRIIQI